MSDLARAVRGFGALVRAEVDLVEAPHVAEVGEALAALGEARVRLTELLTADMRQRPEVWQLHGSLLSGVGRVLAELDVEHHVRERERRRSEAAARRRPSSHAAERWRSTARRAARDHPDPPTPESGS